MKYFLLAALALPGCATMDVSLNGHEISGDAIAAGVIIGVAGGVIIYQLADEDEPETPAGCRDPDRDRSICDAVM